MTQTTKILTHLKRGRSITPLQALNLFGCFRLASRISEIRNMGYDVKGELIKHGETHYKSYWL